MPTRKTPIELLADGESLNRQKRYEANKRKQGFTRLSEWVPADRVDEFKRIVREMVAAHEASK